MEALRTPEERFAGLPHSPCAPRYVEVGVVAATTGLPTGDHAMSEAVLTWQRFAATARSFDVGRVVVNGTVSDLPPDVVAAYDAPFPDDPAAAANRAAWRVLRGGDEPFLTAFSDRDPIAAVGGRVSRQLVPGAAGQPHVTLRGGGHFLQEDVGPELADVVAGFVAATR